MGRALVVNSNGFRLPNGWHGWFSSDDRDGKGVRFPRAARLFAYLGDEDAPSATQVTAEYALHRFRGVSAVLSIDSEDTTVGVNTGWLSLYLSTNRWRWRWRKDDMWGHEREVRLAIVHGALSWCLWSSTADSSNPRQGYWNWQRALQGRARHASEPLGAYLVDVRIPGDDAVYPCRVTLERATWRYPRWPTRVMFTADIEVLSPGGIPYEGTGENAWDIGSDATFSMSCGARTVGEAVGALVRSIVDERVRHGWALPVATKIEEAG